MSDYNKKIADIFQRSLPLTPSFDINDDRTKILDDILSC